MQSILHAIDPKMLARQDKNSKYLFDKNTIKMIIYIYSTGDNAKNGIMSLTYLPPVYIYSIGHEGRASK